MNSQAENKLHPEEKIKQLETENQALRAQLSQVHQASKAELSRFEALLTRDKEYQESQDRFRTIFEQSRLGNKIITSDLRIIKVNKALEAMLGYSKDELEGTRILEYARADYEKAWHELQENLWTKKIPSFGIETVLVRKDGSCLWCSVTSILFTDGEDTLGYTILEDITGRKALEARLEKVYEAQETMMHTVAHDLKNPLHHIKTLNGFLKKELNQLESASPRSFQYLTMVEEACEKAQSIIKDLLLIGELESHPLTFHKETTEMKGFLDDQLSLFKLMAQQKGVTLLLELPSEPVLVPVHPGKLARVVENLLSNAVKFTREGGKVTVSLQTADQKVILKVQDTGVGIPEALQKSVFEKFTKASRQGTQGEETTGLGLFIVRKIVELHQGRIWLESTGNEGTTFYIELPVG